MTSLDIKNAIENLNPDEKLKSRVKEKIFSENVKNSNIKHPFRKMPVAAACLAAVICLSFVVCPALARNNNGVTVPSGEVSYSPASSTMPFIVYDGRIYHQMRHFIIFEDFSEVSAITGEKIGRTALNGIDADTSCYGVGTDFSDFTSLIPDNDVFTVKNHDVNNFLLTIADGSDKNWAYIWYCFDGLEISRGEDVFNKIMTEEQVVSIKYGKLDYSNRYGKLIMTDFNNSEIADAIVKNLYNGIPEIVPGYEIGEDIKVVDLYSADNLSISLLVDSDGYIYFNVSPSYFIKIKADFPEFSSFWNTINQTS